MGIQKPARESNFELLRIVAIIFVMYTHYTRFRSGLEDARCAASSYYLAQMFTVLSMNCVNLFLLMSGYFMVKMDMRRLKWGKVLTLLIMASFYCFLKDGPFLAAEGKLTLTEAVKMLLPSNYFINIYCAVYILSPFINKAMQFDKGTRLRFVLLAFLLFSAWPNVMNGLRWWYGLPLNGSYPTTMMGTEAGFTFLNFTLCYIIGAWIRLDNPFARVAKKWRAAVVLVIPCAIAALGMKIPGLVFVNAITAYDSVFCIIMSTLIFSIFAEWHIGYHRWINVAAKATLVVFLINGAFLVLMDMFNVNSMLPHSGIWFFASSLACLIAIWAICVGVYYLMTWIFAPLIRWWQRTRIYNTPIYRVE